MNEKQYKIYLEEKKEHKRSIERLSLNKKRAVNRGYYNPFLHHINAKFKNYSPYPCWIKGKKKNKWKLYTTKMVAINESRNERISLDTFIERYLNPNKNLINEKSNIKEIYCCGCKKYVNANLVKGDIIYPHREDLYNLNFFQCNCGLYVGTHKNSFKDPKPLGHIPTKEIKNARQHIHKILDPLWKEGKVDRKKLYQHISIGIGWSYHTAKIKTIEEARKIYKIINSYKEINKKLNE